MNEEAGGSVLPARIDCCLEASLALNAEARRRGRRGREEEHEGGGEQQQSHHLCQLGARFRRFAGGDDIT